MAMTLPVVSARMSRSRIMRRSRSISTSTGTSANNAAASSVEGAGILLLQIDGGLRQLIGRRDDLRVSFITALHQDQVGEFASDIDGRGLQRAAQHFAAACRIRKADRGRSRVRADLDGVVDSGDE